MRFNLSSLITLVVAVSASAVVAQPSKRARSINPPQSQNAHVDLTALPPVDLTPVTNAKRFAQGLPPLSPVKRRPHRGGPHRNGAYPHGGTHVVAAPRAETSSTPTANHKCNILVKTGGTASGFIRSSFNDFGEYGRLQDDQAGALEVSFPQGSISQIDMVANSAPDAINSFPYLSAARGFGSASDDLATDSFNYVVITGNSGPTSPGALPSSSTGNSYTTRTGEEGNSATAIWTYDPTTQNIQAVWVNSDGKSVSTTLVYLDLNTGDDSGNTLMATGDFTSFQKEFECGDTCRPVVGTNILIFSDDNSWGLLDLHLRAPSLTVCN